MRCMGRDSSICTDRCGHVTISDRSISSLSSAGGGSEARVCRVGSRGQRAGRDPHIRLVECEVLQCAWVWAVVYSTVFR